MNHTVPYTPASYVAEPTGLTRRMRTAVLWQCVRFAILNIKMLRLMARSHH